MNKIDDCPCGTGKPLHECCGVFLDKTSTASTAEELMRSRYTAYVLGDTGYLRLSWHPDTCPTFIKLDDSTYWLGLKIKSVQQGNVADDQGQVEFVARYKINGRGFRLHEVSRFVRYKGNWVYLDGEIQE